jgi:23S rRNA (uracil1939-C5)-methyltransferase
MRRSRELFERLRDVAAEIELSLIERGEAREEQSRGFVRAVKIETEHRLTGQATSRLVQRLADFGKRHRVQWWLQSKGPDSVQRLSHDGAGDTGDDRELAYRLPEFDVRMPFRPTDFTQVNPWINRVLVSRAVARLEPAPHERVVDWFCGLGNFTLPLARRASHVIGIEGSAALVERARANAAANGLADRTTFIVRNLFELSPAELADLPADRWLVDPPREGAFALVKAAAELVASGSSWVPPARIVYVSCNPATLARDAGLLVHQAGYRCTHAGVVNMFPHTAHVESMAVFERGAAASSAR